MAKETKIINKPEISIPDTITTTVSGDVSIDDSTPIDTAITGTPNVSVTNTPAVTVSGAVATNATIQGTPAVNSTIQNSNIAVTKSGTWAIDSIGGTVTANSTIQNSTLAVTKSGTWAVDSITADVSTKSQTQYSDSTSNVQYWLGLEEDGQLTKVHNGTATSVKQIFHYALPTTAVDGNCLQRVHHIDSGTITGKVDLLGTWTQVMQDIVAPPISDLTLSASTTVEDQVVNTTIGALATSGSVTGHGTVTWELVSTTLSGSKLRIDGANLEVGPNPIGGSDAGSYDVVIKATDELGGSRTETFSITITSNNITDIALSGLGINNGAADGTDIGNLTCTGGVGDVAFTIQANPSGLANVKITDTGTSTATLEADTGGITSSPATYSLTVRATDTLAQTYDESFNIVVSSDFSNTKAMTRTSTDDDHVYFSFGQPSSHYDSGSGNYWLDDWMHQRMRATDSWSISLWFKITGTPDSSEQYGLLQSGADYGPAAGGSLLMVSNQSGTNGPNKDSDGTYKVGITCGYGVIWHTPASSVNVADGEWHHYVATFDGSLNSLIETTSTSTAQTGTCKHLGSSGDPNIITYIDGAVCAYHVNSDYDSAYCRYFGQWNSDVAGPYRINSAVRLDGNNSRTTSTTPAMYGWGFGYQHNGAQEETLVSNFDEFSFHNITLTATQVGELYNSGTPVTLADAAWTAGTWATSNLLCWFRMFEGDNDNNTTIESLAGTVPLYDWDDTAGSEGYIASDPARTVTPTIKIKNGSGNEVITLTALADGDVYVP